MAIDYAGLERWLLEKDFRYWCFISWAHGGRELTTFVEKLRESMSEEFGYRFGFNGVFLDDKQVRIGEEWPKTVALALSQSVCIVPILMPTYFSEQRKHCAREWAGMEQLSKQRMSPGHPPAILPIVFRTMNPLPSVASRLKYGDLSRPAVQSRDVYKTTQFRHLVQELVSVTIELAEAIRKFDFPIDHSAFSLPETPTFIEAKPSLPKLPMRGK